MNKAIELMQDINKQAKEFSDKAKINSRLDIQIEYLERFMICQTTFNDVVISFLKYQDAHNNSTQELFLSIANPFAMFAENPFDKLKELENKDV